MLSEETPVLTLHERPVLTLLNPVEVEVNRLVTLLLVVLRPVLRLETLLLVELRPVLSDETPVLDADRVPVLRPVLTLLNPVEVEVTGWSRCYRRAQAGAQTADARARGQTPAHVAVDAAQPRGETADCPVEVEVDRLVTLLLVVLRPVLRLETPVLRPADPRTQRGDARAHG